MAYYVVWYMAYCMAWYMAYYVAWYMAYCMAWYMAYYMAWYRSAYMARLWRMVGAYGVWLARLWRAGCGSAMAYGWRLWRMVGAYGVQGAPMACRVRIVWTVYSVRLSSMCRAYVSSWLRLCVVMVAPICRHGCVAMAC